MFSICFLFFGFPFLCLFFYFLRPDPPPATRYAPPATRHASPATRHPSPAEKSCRAKNEVEQEVDDDWDTVAVKSRGKRS